MTLLDETLTILRARWGPRAIQRGSTPAHQACLSTGTPTLDALLGEGWPLGEAHSLVGYGTSGATTLAYRTLAGAQSGAGWPLWVDLPRTFDPRVATAQGVDLECLVVARPTGTEEMARLLRDVLPLGGPVIVNLAFGSLPAAADRLRRYLAPGSLLLWLLPFAAPGTPGTGGLRVTCQRDAECSPGAAGWHSIVTARHRDRLLGHVRLTFEGP